MLVETKVHVGNINNLEVKGSVDLIVEEHDTCRIADYKVLGKTSFSKIKSGAQYIQGKLHLDPSNKGFFKYYLQQMLYCKGTEKLLGKSCEGSSLLLIPREGSMIKPTVNQIEEVWLPYSPQMADRCLERAEKILNFVKDNPDKLPELDKDPDCFYCRFHRTDTYLT